MPFTEKADSPWPTPVRRCLLKAGRKVRALTQTPPHLFPTSRASYTGPHWAQSRKRGPSADAVCLWILAHRAKGHSQLPVNTFAKESVSKGKTKMPALQNHHQDQEDARNRGIDTENIVMVGRWKGGWAMSENRKGLRSTQW